MLKYYDSALPVVSWSRFALRRDIGFVAANVKDQRYSSGDTQEDWLRARPSAVCISGVVRKGYSL